MRTIIALAAVVFLSTGAIAADGKCADKDGGLGVSRIVEIDTSTGPLFGDMSRYAREASFLGPKEVVLTFDDGPLAPVTNPILDTLDKFCTKATFFSVGRMALAYPAIVKDIIARGHTFGGHTWSHANLKASGYVKAVDEIERGFAAMTLAAGQPVAPFFRFPYLNDTDPLLAHLQSRGIAAFTVDVVSNDSYYGNVERLIEHTMHDAMARDGGILLFHDIKSVTARALPEILTQLKAKGFKVVHMRPKAGYTPVADYDAQLTAMMAKSARPAAAGAKPALIPFTTAAMPELPVPNDTAQPVVTQVAPAAKTRSLLPPAAHHASGDDKARRKQRVATTATDEQPKAVKVRGLTGRCEKTSPKPGLA